MSVINNKTSMAMTPVCNTCKGHLCWDISREEYLDRKAFWDSWVCQNCIEEQDRLYELEQTKCSMRM
jgi:hypothetical protein